MTTSSIQLLPRVYNLGFRAGFILRTLYNNRADFYDQLPSLAQIWFFLKSFPMWYKTWWMNLLTNDPVHLVVETTLLASVVYMLVSRSQDWRETMQDKLTQQEEEDLIKEWVERGRAPLVPGAKIRSGGKNANVVVKSGNSVKSAGSSNSDTASPSPVAAAAAAASATLQKSTTIGQYPDFVVHNMRGTQMTVSMDGETKKYACSNFGTFDFLGMSASFTATPATKQVLQQQQQQQQQNPAANNNQNKKSQKNTKPKNKNQTAGSSTKEETRTDISPVKSLEDDCEEGFIVVGGDKNTNTNNNNRSKSSSEEPQTAETAAATETDDATNTNKNKRKRKKKKKKATTTTTTTTTIVDESVANPAPVPASTTTTTTTVTSATGASINPLKDASLEALERYGVGACGPRGFYGTIDPHLQLEEEFTTFMGTEGAILYSDGASTCSSTVAAFCKRGDLLVVDECVNEPLIAGVKLSRAHVKWYKHNDMDDLRRVMEQVQAADQKAGRAPNAQRRFIIAEGMYRNTGTIAPLDKLVALKHEFHYRLILDESISFGTLGPTGRGALEMFNLRPMYDAEVITVALENALGSIGGMTIGNEEVVDHQRLSGSGYCFSAASPPFTASAAIQALRQLKEGPDDVLARLNDNKQYLHTKLKVFLEHQEDLFILTSDEQSPLVFLVLAECPETEDIDDTTFLAEVVRECVRQGVAIMVTGQQNARAGVQLLRKDPPPSIRLTVSAAHSKADIDRAVEVLSDAVEVVMQRYVDGLI